MNIAKQINQKLDEIIEMRKELERMNADLDDDATLTNIQTGEPQTKADAIELIEDLITDVYKQINQISNNGNNVNDIFTNDYYVNDFMQDREIINKPQKPKKENPNNLNRNKVDSREDDPLAMGSPEWMEHMRENGFDYFIDLKGKQGFGKSKLPDDLNNIEMNADYIKDSGMNGKYERKSKHNNHLHLKNLTKEEIIAIKRLLDAMRNNDDFDEFDPF
jgi:hypothetical protein